MEYRIKYFSFVGKNSYEEIKEFEAASDEDAKKEYAKFKEEMENSDTFTKYLVKGMVRIDQREITTRII